MKYFLFLGYLLASCFLFLYSFTQVDLGLTLTQISIWQKLQTFFQHIGYFDRPFSTHLYISLIIIFYTLYFLTLFLVKRNVLKRSDIWKIISLVSLILALSYNAFSYDLFNYVFDAKIVTFYNQNPYIHKALDFPKDPMLSFMHWTHRAYPYGPTWLLATVPLSFLGFRYFLFTLILFKLLAVISFLGSVYFLEKIMEKQNPKHALFSLAFFALNPFMIVESLVSAHNDIFMIFLTFVSFYFLFERKYLFSFLFLLLSVGVKFSTIFLIPFYILVFYFLYTYKKINIEKVFIFITIGMIFPVILASFRTNFQPWYLLNTIPFMAFVSYRYFVFIPAVVVSLFALFEYIPFLYTGNWNPPIPSLLQSIRIWGLILSVMIVVLEFLRKSYRERMK